MMEGGRGESPSSVGDSRHAMRTTTTHARSISTAQRSFCMYTSWFVTRWEGMSSFTFSLFGSEAKRSRDVKKLLLQKEAKAQAQALQLLRHKQYSSIYSCIMTWWARWRAFMVAKPYPIFHFWRAKKRKERRLKFSRPFFFRLLQVPPKKEPSTPTKQMPSKCNKQPPKLD